MILAVRTSVCSMVTRVSVAGAVIEEACDITLEDGVVNACGITVGKDVADTGSVILEGGVTDICDAVLGEEQVASVVSNRTRMPTKRNLEMILNIALSFLSILPLST